MSNRWLGSAVTMQSLTKGYVLDGMMADWLDNTAPAEAAKYSGRLPDDMKMIKAEAYSLGKPSLAQPQVQQQGNTPQA